MSRKIGFVGLGKPVLLLLIVICEHLSCEPASCGSALNNGDAGSGFVDSSVCGDSSECFNDAICQCVVSYFSPSGNHTDCRDPESVDPRCSQFDDDCVYCGSRFSGPCQGCLEVLYDDQCLNQCPQNTQLEIVRDTNTNLLIRNCEGSALSLLPDWAIIVIAVLGAVGLVSVAIGIAAVACCFLRRSSVGQLDIAERNDKSDNEQVDAAPGTIGKPNYNENGGVMEDYFEADIGKLSDEETNEFFSKLAVLRTQRDIFLKMINDMRRRLKELPQTSPATQQYRDVIRDLSRLLFILNAKPEAVRIPPDGIQLLDWSEQILNRYLTAQGKPTININVSAGATNAGSGNPNRISIIGDQATTHF